MYGAISSETTHLFPSSLVTVLKRFVGAPVVSFFSSELFGFDSDSLSVTVLGNVSFFSICFFSYLYLAATFF